MSELEFLICNRAYGEQWLDELSRSSAHQYAVVKAILDVIHDNDGGDISQAEVCAKDPEVAAYILRSGHCVVPSSGLLLRHNGAGIRHAKYSPSKNIAILWEKIDDVIFFTFDDHAPVRFHRAIHAFCERRLGREVFPIRSRNSRAFMAKVWATGRRKNRGFDARRKHYK